MCCSDQSLTGQDYCFCAATVHQICSDLLCCVCRAVLCVMCCVCAMSYCVCSTLSIDTYSLRALVRIALRDAAYETPRVLYLYLYPSSSTQHEFLLTAPCTVHLFCDRLQQILTSSLSFLRNPPSSVFPPSCH